MVNGLGGDGGRHAGLLWGVGYEVLEFGGKAFGKLSAEIIVA